MGSCSAIVNGNIRGRSAISIDRCNRKRCFEHEQPIIEDLLETYALAEFYVPILLLFLTREGSFSNVRAVPEAQTYANF